MRTITRETVFQIDLRNCSNKVVGNVSKYVLLVMGEYMQLKHVFLQQVSAGLMKVTSSHEQQWRMKEKTMKYFCAFLDTRRYKNWPHEIGS